MKLKRSLILSFFFLAACGKSAESETVPPSGQDKQTTEMGPYTVAFAGPEETYEHTMKGVPVTDEGKVEYFITTNEKSKITLVKTELKVTGCSASQVTHHTFWVPDAEKPTQGQLVLAGLQFEPQPSVKGIFLHVIKGLNGCSEVELSTSLKRSKLTQPNPTFPVGQNCAGQPASDGCKVQVYCREQDPLSNYVEVEVWKQSWGLQIRKYMHRSDGTQSLMLSETGTLSDAPSTTTYWGSSSTLKFGKTSGEGTFSESVNGQTFKTDLDCAWL
ncbi:MAG: hypothetical protein ACAH59_00470 [Pseudobdellovibrionaceae bacterium]